MPPTETLWFVLGDQLDPRFSVFRRHFDKQRDVVLMAEVSDESRHVPSHKQRTALFLSAMRHYAERLRERQVTVRYTRLDDAGNAGTLAGELRKAIDAVGPARLAITRPGEWRVLRMIERIAAQRGLPLVVHEDPHFLLTPAEFSAWANGRSELVMEHFYRMMRRKYNVLVAADGKPEGGEWNFDAENRKKFKGNRATLPPRLTHAPDAITTAVLRTVDATLRDLPGDTATFNWPVTREQAVAELHDFIRHRLRHFGDYQDAMVTGEPWLYHSLLSAPMNLKLLNPREIVPLAVEAYRRGVAPLNAVEGFVRQVMGWREFIRGVYWREGPDYADRNALNQRRALPAFYWTGETEMHCLRESIGEVLRHGFGHHIQRLMVTGNFAMMAGADPRAVSDWYLGMYVDAVDWVTLPNTLGMSQHADGGVVGTKPYAASGRYIEKMGDYCTGCRFQPGTRVGEHACPFTTFYWDFLIRHEARFASNHRMALPLKHVSAMADEEKRGIAQWAEVVRGRLGMR
ncbi:MAG: cryptochrome/photolyase family protein [Gemmatimonadetes bacterium]|nr:cryptochrome/photolyase family protein [Gemmatimonadota bacterium]